MAESEEEIKSPLMKLKEGSEKVVLNSAFKKLKSWHQVSSLHGKLLDRWGNNGNSERLYFGGSKITVDGDCSHETKRHLLLGRKTMTNLDSVLQIRDITLLPKVCIVKAMFFPVVMYGCESWTIKKAERWRTHAFKLCCWRWLLRIPLTARSTSQSYRKSALNIQWKDWCWSNNILAAWWGGLTHWKRPWCWERFKEREGVTEDEMIGWHHRLNGQEFEQAPGDSDGQGGLLCCSS